MIRCSRQPVALQQQTLIVLPPDRGTEDRLGSDLPDTSIFAATVCRTGQLLEPFVSHTVLSFGLSRLSSFRPLPEIAPFVHLVDRHRPAEH